MSEFKIIETQEEFDKRIADRLEQKERAVKREYEEKYSNYGELSTKNEALNSENEQLKEQLKKFEGKEAISTEDLASLNEQVKKYESDSVKTRIAKEYNLPDGLAARLTGDDEEALRKDAEALSSVVSQSSIVQTLPLGDAETQGNSSENAAKKMVNEITRKGD